MADKIVAGTRALKKHEVARPLHIQRLEAALDVRAFVSHVESVLGAGGRSDSDDDSDARPSGEMSKGDRIVHGVVTTKQERQSDRQRLFNLSAVGGEREWLRAALLSSSGSDSSSDDDTPEARERYVRRLLVQHMFHKRHAAKLHANPAYSRYMYYGAGLLSTVDRYPERRGARAGAAAAAATPRGRRPRALAAARAGRDQRGGDDVDGTDWEEQLKHMKQENNTESKPADYNSKAAIRARKKAAAMRSPEALTARRRRHWQLMAKKELGKVQRARAQQHKELAQQRRRLAALCCKHWRARAMQSQKNMKETVWRCKRLSREMQAYWRRYDRAERETRRRMEREAEEQRKMDVEMMEAKRQRRKLNFLITQTELYAHFMQRKLGAGAGVGEGEGEDVDAGAEHILGQLEDTRLTQHDHYDSEEMKAQACHNAREAFRTDRARVRTFDTAAGAAGAAAAAAAAAAAGGDYDQPTMFRGTLKGYQLKGMNWLANLYDQGISGILADEMGLGKTVQCIAFLCHVAERLGVWGPFLVVSPASTLHNWQQEMQRFVPDFKVVPYWGSPSERRILRQFWERRDLHTPSAAFHVVVTSYQIVVSDLKYLNRVAWQHMILDEAQAIKSSASMRWKLLLGFSCRNRLLLSGTPIQNSMAELWALLHFIMPTLFDSHAEFNEWFSKDIESHAENKTTIDEKHLSRLHMILKPFMLRRIKRDVENELSDKIEVMVHCPLTIRQKLLYMALKKKIKIEELLHYTGESGGGGGGGGADKNFTSSLMNLVMQFRKVCNHPELFERRDVRSPLALHCDDYHVPRLVAERGVLARALPSRRHLLYSLLSVHTPERVHRSAAYGFARLASLSPRDVYLLQLCGWYHVLKHLEECQGRYDKLRHRQVWWRADGGGDAGGTKVEGGGATAAERAEYVEYYRATHTRDMLLVCAGGDVLRARRGDSELWRALLFTEPVWNDARGVFYTHTDHTIHYMPETIEHRAMRRRHTCGLSRDDFESTELLQHIKTEEGGVTPLRTEAPASPRTLREQPTALPAFLFTPVCKVSTFTRKMYATSREAAYTQTRHEHCENAEGYELLARLCAAARHPSGWSYIQVPDKNQLVSDAGKLTVLDSLLRRLKERGHRVLIYSQMTKMIDILEEYMWHRKHKYMRLDGSSKISARRDMVADFQARADIFVFLLSTRAGGLGINLTAADTVIFYDSDWNPTVDQQAMDRAHRLGQTKQVTVYRLICKGTIEERIMERAREKSEIQRMVISGGNFKPESLKPKEVVSLLLDDEEIEQKYHLKSEERRPSDDGAPTERKRKLASLNKGGGGGNGGGGGGAETKRARGEEPWEGSGEEEPASPAAAAADDGDSTDALVVDDAPSPPPPPHPLLSSSGWGGGAKRSASRRGRPRGARSQPPVRPRAHAAAAAAHAHADGYVDVAGGSLAQPEEIDVSQMRVVEAAGGGGGSRSRRGPGRPPRPPKPPARRHAHRPAAAAPAAPPTARSRPTSTFAYR